MAIFTTFRTTADAEAVLPALLKLGVMLMSKSARDSPIVWQRLGTKRGDLCFRVCMEKLFRFCSSKCSVLPAAAEASIVRLPEPVTAGTT
jgi:hypothetical protein